MTMAADGIKLHKGNFRAIGNIIAPLLSSGQVYRLILKPWRDKRSIPQNSLSHMWYAEISEYLICSGRTDATPEWVKRNLKKTYLGCVEVEYVDFVTGEKTMTWEPRHTSGLDTGEMHYFLCQVEKWCAQFGLALTIPDNSEFMQLRRQQDGQ